MWLTSNRPTAVRTVLCSSTSPEYWTGMSQPPKSTIFAPSARCTAFSGVRFKSTLVSIVGRDYFAGSILLTCRMFFASSVPFTITFLPEYLAPAELIVQHVIDAVHRVRADQQRVTRAHRLDAFGGALHRVFAAHGRVVPGAHVVGNHTGVSLGRIGCEARGGGQQGRERKSHQF